ncbi:MAG TPA: phosphoglycerate mutase [Rhodanobacteraceae bacterium]|nr:phosphoglycerate mutase [Rhodanobacteraceae bacterium]
MSVLHVLLPALPRSRAEQVFVCWLRKGRRLPDVPDLRAAVIRGMFRFNGESIPVAALRHHVHGSDAGTGFWMCADPAYVRSEAAGARLMACPVTDLVSDEARAFAVALGPLFGEAGLALAVDTPSAWCVHLGGEAPGVAFTGPGDALGADLLDCLPQGEAGRSWRRLFNEGQIALHAHPANAERIAAGKLPVNALWFWGAGRLPGSVESPLALLASSDDVLRGLARLAGIACAGPAPEALDATRQSGDVLLDLVGQDLSGALARWLPRFRQVLRERRFEAVELLFPGGERFRVRHAHRLRFWRRG